MLSSHSQRGDDVSGIPALYGRNHERAVDEWVF